MSFATNIFITNTDTANNRLLSNFFNNPFERATKNKAAQGIKYLPCTPSEVIHPTGVKYKYNPITTRIEIIPPITTNQIRFLIFNFASSTNSANTRIT